MKTFAIAAVNLALAGPVQAETASYDADPMHTFVTFEARHFGTSTLRGRFDRKEGSVFLDRVAKTGKAEFTIDTTSVSAGVPVLDARLKGKDFFNAGQLQIARFVGDKFIFAGDKVASVGGTLMMLGKTLPITLTASHFTAMKTRPSSARSAAATSRSRSRAASGAWVMAWTTASRTTFTC